nr:uncharacterized protein [Tanacetum cinerariifolium]
MKLIMLQLMVEKPFGGGKRNGKGETTRPEESRTTDPRNLYEDDQRLDEKEYEKSEKMRLLEFRLNSYHKFCQMVEPKCHHEDDPGLIKYFNKLGISLNEKYQLANVAKNAVLGTISIRTTHRTNAMEMVQFERTRIVAEDRHFVEYLEECIVPSYDINQLDAAVVELHCNEEAKIKYLTVQNWYAGNENRKGGIYNFVIEKGLYVGRRSKDILKL